MTRRFDALLFDAGGVFLVPDPLTTGMVLEPFGGTTNLGKLVRCHYAGMAAIDDATTSQAAGSIDQISWISYRRAYARESGVPVKSVDKAAEALLRVFSAFLWRFPLHESVAALWRLHLIGVRIGIVSNASGQIERTLANENVCQVGEGSGVPVLIVTDSYVVGVAKPESQIFDEAVGVMDVPRERIAYIGDSYVNDVGGARNALLNPVLLDPFGFHFDKDCERIASLHDLVAFVR
ncbi:MAG: HAD hydrolase-like protein [Actinobacteria bacterium]|nr:HAD hydrolase-like protein [Actinomycetota bacterium]